MGKGKARGLNAARKLKILRKKTYWKQKNERKKVQPHYIADPLTNSGFVSGIVVEKGAVFTKIRRRSTYGTRRLVKVQLMRTGQRVLAFVPFDGGIHYIDESDLVLLCKVRKGKNIGDIDVGAGSVKYKVIKVSGVSLYALTLEKKDKLRR
jgi:Ribosomal protein S12